MNTQVQNKTIVTQRIPYTLTLLFTLLLTAFTSCEEAVEPEAPVILPSYTQEGANTLGFTIGSRIFTTEGKRSIQEPEGTIIKLESEQINILSSHFSSGNAYTFNLVVQSVRAPYIGTYRITPDSGIGTV